MAPVYLRLCAAQPRLSPTSLLRGSTLTQRQHSCLSHALLIDNATKSTQSGRRLVLTTDNTTNKTKLHSKNRRRERHDKTEGLVCRVQSPMQKRKHVERFRNNSEETFSVAPRSRAKTFSVLTLLHGAFTRQTESFGSCRVVAIVCFLEAIVLFVVLSVVSTSLVLIVCF